MTKPVCAAAVELVIYAEVTDRRTYDKRYAVPTVPPGDSGVTIGIGWDCGQNGTDDLDREWAHLDAASRLALASVMGLKGDKARAALPKVLGVRVPWEAAVHTFAAHTLPRYVARTRAAFPGSDALPAECFGVLVDLVYNRGTAMDGDRRREMRDIRDLIAAGRLAEVPAQLRAMKRLWPDLRGLQKRRDDEAALWEHGLQVSLQSAAV